MARFYGTMGGGRGTTSRTGTTNSGLEAHVRGWDVGVMVSARAAHPGRYAGVGSDDYDVIDVYITGGSNGSAPVARIGTVRLEDGVPVFQTADDASWESVR